MGAAGRRGGDRGDGPHQRADAGAVTAVLAQAFQALPPKLQAVAALALIEQCPLAEIA